MRAWGLPRELKRLPFFNVRADRNVRKIGGEAAEKLEGRCVRHRLRRLSAALVRRGSHHYLTGMHKPSRAYISGLVGLTAFGVAYDSGLFGTPDGYDHSAMISVASSTGTLAWPAYAVLNNVTGEAVTIVPHGSYGAALSSLSRTTRS